MKTLMLKTEEPVQEDHYAYLMAYAGGQGNDDALACMYASWKAGKSALTEGWGLLPGELERMMRFHFPGCDLNEALWVRDADCDAAASDRNDEQAELIDLMLNHRADLSPSEQWIASIVAAACLGGNHLWQDLGLWCREDLSNLMQRNFPALANKNVHNMKWKKFLYKQLCITEGVYVCRSPSCEVCVDYDACFGPED
jgi:nitrogen fixation protein NifQ